LASPVPLPLDRRLNLSDAIPASNGFPTESSTQFSFNNIPLENAQFIGTNFAQFDPSQPMTMMWDTTRQTLDHAKY